MNDLSLKLVRLILVSAASVSLCAQMTYSKVFVKDVLNYNEMSVTQFIEHGFNELANQSRLSPNDQVINQTSVSLPHSDDDKRYPKISLGQLLSLPPTTWSGLLEQTTSFVYGRNDSARRHSELKEQNLNRHSEPKEQNLNRHSEPKAKNLDTGFEIASYKFDRGIYDPTIYDQRRVIASNKEKPKTNTQTVKIAVFKTTPNCSRDCNHKIETDIPLEPASPLSVLAGHSGASGNQDASHMATKPDLLLTDELVSLDELKNKRPLSASYHQHRKIDSTTGTGEQPKGGDKGGDDTLSLEDSARHVKKTIVQEKIASEQFSRDVASLKYSDFSIQVMDERSDPKKGLIYPVVGVKVMLIGTDFSALTNSTGHVHIKNVPQNSRYLVSVYDPTGTVRPTVDEIRVTKNQMNDRVYPVFVRRDQSFTVLSEIAKVGDDSRLGSMCVELKNDAQLLSNVKVKLNVYGQGPYYFNRFGFLDSAEHATNQDGKFCYFNVDPGPILFSFYDHEEQYFSSIPIVVYSGKHQELRFNLAQIPAIQFHLAAAATAHEQVNTDQVAANSFRPIDAINVYPIGERDPAEVIVSGKLAFSEDLAAYKNRVFALSQAAEFEDTLYSFNSDEDNQVVSLLPRGFVEDMSLYAQVSYDPILGVVVVEHNYLNGQGEEPVQLKLLDHNNQAVGEGWHFADGQVTKAIFYNLAPGKYAMITETKDGYWIAAETVLVYSETVSYVRMGSPVKK